jgi:hypothetical protein
MAVLTCIPRLVGYTLTYLALVPYPFFLLFLSGPS